MNVRPAAQLFGAAQQGFDIVDARHVAGILHDKLAPQVEFPHELRCVAIAGVDGVRLRPVRNDDHPLRLLRQQGAHAFLHIAAEYDDGCGVAVEHTVAAADDPDGPAARLEHACRYGSVGIEVVDQQDAGDLLSRAHQGHQEG